jgi:hypothetical protein
MTSRSIKQFAAAAGAALVLGGAALGIAAAQQTPTPTTAQATPTRPGGTPGQQRGPGQDQRQELLNRVASKLGITVDRLQQAFTDARQELGIPDRPAGGFRDGEPRPSGRGFGIDLLSAAQAMNLQPDQLRQELPGKSLTDVARAHNVDPSVVANALKAQASQRIDQAAANGRIAADQVATAKQQANQRIDELMTHQTPAMGQGGPGDQRGPRSFGPGPQAPGQPGAPQGPRI